jgi:hypothetical protein
MQIEPRRTIRVADKVQPTRATRAIVPRQMQFSNPSRPECEPHARKADTNNSTLTLIIQRHGEAAKSRSPRTIASLPVM